MGINGLYWNKVKYNTLILYLLWNAATEQMFILKDATMKFAHSNTNNGYSKLNLWNN